MKGIHMLSLLQKHYDGATKMKKYTTKFQALLIVLYLVLTPICTLTASEPVPAILEQFDEASVLTVLHDEVPNFEIKTMELLSNGWDNLVAEINGEWIFRFPRTEAFVLRFERERLLLDRLHQHVSLPIPYYEFMGVHTAFVGYRKIPGEALDEKLYLTFSIETRQEIAETLALFLTQLHGGISVEEALQWGYGEYRVPLQWIECSLLGTLPTSDIERIVSEALDYAKLHPYRVDHRVLLHNDLHGENFALDVSTHKVNGIFDFSDAMIGDYTIEFGKLFCVHHDLAFRTSEAYALLNEVSNPIIPAAVDYILRRATYILYNREMGVDSFHEKRLIRMLENFVPIWDELGNDIPFSVDSVVNI
jgi:aminoglycoside 2''-phosphotransferase